MKGMNNNMSRTIEKYSNLMDKLENETQINSFLEYWSELSNNHIKEIQVPCLWDSQTGDPIQYKWIVDKNSKYTNYLTIHHGMRQEINITKEIELYFEITMLRNDCILFESELGEKYVIDNYYTDYNGSLSLAGVKIKKVVIDLTKDIDN